MRAYRRRALLLFGALVLGAGCSAPERSAERKDDAGETAERFAAASWAESYVSLGELIEAADLVVHGTVAESEEASMPRSSDPAHGPLAFTDFTIDVIEVLRGDDEPPSIVVHQTGGRNGDHAFEIRDDPLFDYGAEYLLFLRHDPTTGRHAVVGGPDGRLIVRDQQVYALSVTYPDRNIGDTGIDGLTLDEVRTAIAGR